MSTDLAGSYCFLAHLIWISLVVLARSEISFTLVSKLIRQLCNMFRGPDQSNPDKTSPISLELVKLTFSTFSCFDLSIKKSTIGILK